MTTIEATSKEQRKRGGPVQFLKEVRAEARKVTWTSRKETAITTVMVFIMVVLAAIFFFVADIAMGALVRALLALGH